MSVSGVSEPDKNTERKINMSNNHVEAVKKSYEDFLKDDLSTLINNLDENVEWNQPGSGNINWAGKFKGKEGVMNFFNELSTFKIKEFNPHTYIAAGDNVVALGYTKAVTEKTGKESYNDWCMVWTFKNGKIISWYDYCDTEAIAKSYTNN